jgi:hypothetical protein
MSHRAWINAGKRWRVFGGGSGTTEGLNAVALGVDTSQQPLLTTPQHA